MKPSCPISLKSIDTHIVRIIAFQIAMNAIIFLATQESFFVYMIFFDFFLRALRKQQFSPFHTISRFIVQTWAINPKLCDESPKRFALLLGLGVSFLMLLSHLAGLYSVSLAITAVLIVCAALETLFDFCIGCKLYFVIEFIKRGMNYDRYF